MTDFQTRQERERKGDFQKDTRSQKCFLCFVALVRRDCNSDGYKGAKNCSKIQEEEGISDSTRTRVDSGTGSRPRGTGSSLDLEENISDLVRGWRNQVNKEIYRHEPVTWMICQGAVMAACLTQYDLETGWHVMVDVLEDGGENL